MLDLTIYQTVVDSLSAHVAILDENGVIIDTNRAWKEFAMQNGMKQPVDIVGVNYLNICERSGVGERFQNDDAGRVAAGIRKVTVG